MEERKVNKKPKTSSLPHYSELGKESRLLFDGTFCFGTTKVSYAKKICDESVRLNSATTYSDKNGLNANIQAKYQQDPNSDTSILQKVTSKGCFTTSIVLKEGIMFDGVKPSFDVSINPNAKLEDAFKVTATLKNSDAIARGTKHTTVISYVPFSGLSQLTLKNCLVHGTFNGSFEVNIWKNKKQSICTSAVVKSPFVQGGFLGLELDLGKKTKYSLSTTFPFGQVNVHTLVNDQAVSITGHTRQWQNVQVATRIKLPHDSASEMELGLAGKWDLNKTSFVKAKLDNKLCLGLAFSFQPIQGVKLALCCQAQMTDVLSPEGHKFGLDLQM